MDISQIGLFGLAEQRLGWLERRQQLLAQNIANADTPGWRPRDLRPFQAALSQATAGSLSATRPNHLPGTLAAGAGIDTAARPRERAPDGNAVSVEDQLMKVADSEGSQELVTNLYQKYLGLFRLALGRTQ